jgi:hypothetical protein
VTSRSAQSLRFEEIVRQATPVRGLALLQSIAFSAFGDLTPWVSVIEPDQATFTLKFVRAGEGLCGVLGCDLAGRDYLEFVDPAIKGEAFDSTFLMLSRPCGLWQITPALTQDGAIVEAEYTGFPIYDAERARGLLITLAHVALDPLPRIAQVRHATEWAWLDLKSGGALLH